jgi:hypothetical protein
MLEEPQGREMRDGTTSLYSHSGQLKDTFDDANNRAEVKNGRSLSELTTIRQLSNTGSCVSPETDVHFTQTISLNKAALKDMG